MVVWDKKVLCGFVFLLAAAGSQRVNYPAPVCAVRGSTVTLLCTFTPTAEGESVEIIRVVWCQNHEICQGSTPSVYDSKEQNNKNNPRYRYLGDQKGNCTIQITDMQKEDNGSLHFRMEMTETAKSFTGPAGVRVTVTDETQMKIQSSRDGAFKRGEAVTLNCTATCSFLQLEVNWFRDGHALPFTGPVLHLGSLTAEDSGNYTCGLNNSNVALSQPHSLFVEAEEEAGAVQVSLVVGVVFGVLLALSSLVLVLCIIKRKPAPDKSQPAVREEAGLKNEGAEDDTSYAPIKINSKSQTRKPAPDKSQPAVREEAGLKKEGAEDDVSYAPIKIKARSRTSPVTEAEDAIIYSTVSGRA